MSVPPIPVICDNCGKVSAAAGLFRVAGGATIVVNNCSTNCPRCGAPARLADATIRGGHNDTVEVQTYGLTPDQMNEFFRAIRAEIERLRSVDPKRFEAVRRVTDQASRGEISTEEAATQIAEQLPEISAAAIKQYGARNTLNTVAIVLGLLGSAATVATGVKDIWNWLSPPAVEAPPPAAPIVIHNHITIVDGRASSVTGSLPKPPIVKREQVRRIKQLEAQRQKRAQQQRDTNTQTKPQKR